LLFTDGNYEIVPFENKLNRNDYVKRFNKQYPAIAIGGE